MREAGKMPALRCEVSGGITLTCLNPRLYNESVPMKCALCQERSGKRYCPGVRGYICAPCCGKEREVSISCPFECVHLQEAYRHEMRRLERPKEPVYAACEVTDELLERHNSFVHELGVCLLEYAGRYPDTVDADVRDALDALIRTYQTLDSGLIYETLPQGPLRAHLCREVQGFVAEWRKERSRDPGLPALLDGVVLRVLVFWRRVAQVDDNRRPLGRSFLAFLRRALSESEPREAPRIIVPGA